MSHIVEGKTSIANPNQDLLRQAATLVAGQHGGTVQAFYLDYFKRSHSCPLAISAPTMTRGIGIKVDESTGVLTFIGDNWGVQQEYAAIQQEIVQMYVSLATMQALQQMGYTAQATDGEAGTGQVVIQGVSYA